MQSFICFFCTRLTLFLCYQFGKGFKMWENNIDVPISINKPRPSSHLNDFILCHKLTVKKPSLTKMVFVGSSVLM